MLESLHSSARKAQSSFWEVEERRHVYSRPRALDDLEHAAEQQILSGRESASRARDNAFGIGTIPNLALLDCWKRLKRRRGQAVLF